MTQTIRIFGVCLYSTSYVHKICPQNTCQRLFRGHVSWRTCFLEGVDKYCLYNYFSYGTTSISHLIKIHCLLAVHMKHFSEIFWKFYSVHSRRSYWRRSGSLRTCIVTCVTCSHHECYPTSWMSPIKLPI